VSTHEGHSSLNQLKQRSIINRQCTNLLASCLIYAWALLEYVIVIVWVRSVNKMLPSVKFVEDKVLTFLTLHEIANIVQL